MNKNIDFSKLHTLGIYGSDPVLTAYALERDGCAPLMLLGYNGSFYTQYGAPYSGAAERSLKGKAAETLIAKREEINAAYRAFAERHPDTPTPAPAPETPAPAPAVSPLETALADAIASVAADRVTATILDDVKKRVADEIGLIPRRLEISTPDGAKREVKGITHAVFGDVLKCINAHLAVFLTGAAGTGKNVIAKQVADALGLPFYFTSAVTQEYKLCGFTDAHGRYQATQFYRAFAEGGLFFFDELDASVPDALLTINAALANGYCDFPAPIGRVEAHEDFRVIAAGNTLGTGADNEYTGRLQLDAATLNRFIIFKVDYDERIEEASANGNTDALRFCRAFRSACGIKGINAVISYRNISQLATLSALGLDDKQAVYSAVSKALGADDLAIIADALPADNRYTTAVKAIIKEDK